MRKDETHEVKMHIFAQVIQKQTLKLKFMMLHSRLLLGFQAGLRSIVISVCVCVCLSVRSHISQTTCLNFL